jgi:hypothetical protein
MCSLVWSAPGWAAVRGRSADSAPVAHFLKSCVRRSDLARARTWRAASPGRGLRAVRYRDTDANNLPTSCPARICGPALDPWPWGKDSRSRLLATARSHNITLIPAHAHAQRWLSRPFSRPAARVTGTPQTAVCPRASSVRLPQSPAYAMPRHRGLRVPQVPPPQACSSRLLVTGPPQRAHASGYGHNDHPPRRQRSAVGAAQSAAL